MTPFFLTSTYLKSLARYSVTLPVVNYTLLTITWFILRLLILSFLNPFGYHSILIYWLVIDTISILVLCTYFTSLLSVISNFVLFTAKRKIYNLYKFLYYMILTVYVFLVFKSISEILCVVLEIQLNVNENKSNWFNFSECFMILIFNDN